MADKSTSEEFKGLISMLKFFADSGRVNILDRIGFAQSPVAVKEAIYEAMRIIDALSRSPVRVRVKVGPNDDERELECIEYEEMESERGVCRGVKGKVVKSSSPRIPEGSTICCYLKPMRPSQEELDKLFTLLNEDPLTGLNKAKEIASLAFAWKSR